ncbi:MAG: hypothetical protein A4E19_18750 [Nitrospira sp. SG-bin1]|nr:MAG: hypothetical protein A4E19_18750 [Nitrospira sp. SG-bin1]
MIMHTQKEAYMTHPSHKNSPNTNCLEGWHCPDCHSWGPFTVEVTTYVLLWDDGSDLSSDHGSHAYDDASVAICKACGKHATVGDFHHEEV